MHTSSIPTHLVGSTLGAIAAAACVLLGTPTLAANQLLVYSPAGTLLQALPVFRSH